MFQNQIDLRFLKDVRTHWYKELLYCNAASQFIYSVKITKLLMPIGRRIFNTFQYISRVFMMVCLSDRLSVLNSRKYTLITI